MIPHIQTNIHETLREDFERYVTTNKRQKEFNLSGATLDGQYIYFSEVTTRGFEAYVAAYNDVMNLLIDFNHEDSVVVLAERLITNQNHA